MALPTVEADGQEAVLKLPEPPDEELVLELAVELEPELAPLDEELAAVLLPQAASATMATAPARRDGSVMR
jgi:hypothetical protein